jgi:hypothetical protein
MAGRDKICFSKPGIVADMPWHGRLEAQTHLTTKDPFMQDFSEPLANQDKGTAQGISHSGLVLGLRQAVNISQWGTHCHSEGDSAGWCPNHPPDRARLQYTHFFLKHRSTSEPGKYGEITSLQLRTQPGLSLCPAPCRQQRYRVYKKGSWGEGAGKK